MNYVQRQLRDLPAHRGLLQDLACTPLTQGQLTEKYGFVFEEVPDDLSKTEASFIATFDTSTRCVTRDGTATTSIGGRSFSRTVEDYERCGIGRLGCPESGKVTLSRTKGGETLSLTIEFNGGRSYTVTRPNGTEIDRQLVCREQ